jgi:hypothetical protein
VSRARGGVAVELDERGETRWLPADDGDRQR